MILLKKQITRGILLFLAVICIFGLLLTIISCQPAEREKEEPTVQKSEAIYIIGRAYLGNTFYDAVYWKDGTTYKLSTTGIISVPSSGSFAQSIASYGGNIYICGHYLHTNLNQYVPCYWINGTFTTLDPTFFGNEVDGYANSITVNNTGFYIAGYKQKWSDGIPHLTYGKNCFYTWGKSDINSRGKSIALSDSDVYIAGSYNNGNENVACYWKNGTITELSALSSVANSVIISGTDIYIAGYYNDGSKNIACYWKNGTITELSTLSSVANSVIISGTDIYIAGYYNDGSKNIACYWKNGTITVLSALSSVANSIVINGIDIYVAGYYNDGSKNNACYWKNGTNILLRESATAQSILIIK